MIMNFRHGRSSETRLWINESIVCPAGDQKLTSRLLPVSGVYNNGNRIALEFSTPRHISSYGHLGLEFTPNDSMRSIILDVMFCDKLQSLYADSLSYNKNKTYTGLHIEYADSVFQTAKEFITEHKNMLSPGIITIDSAAHCQISSSINAFKALTYVTLSLLINCDTLIETNEIAIQTYIDECFSNAHDYFGVNLI